MRRVLSVEVSFTWNLQVTTNYVVVLQKTGDPGDGSTSLNKKVKFPASKTLKKRKITATAKVKASSTKYSSILTA